VVEMDVKEKYEELKKKYKLPSYEEVNTEFELESIEKPVFLLNDIGRKINEKLDYYLAILENILNPESSLASMYECKVTGEGSKKEINLLYKKMMVMKRSCDVARVNNSEKDVGEFVSAFFKEWEETKPKLLKLISMLKEEWKKSEGKKESFSYFG